MKYKSSVLCPEFYSTFFMTYDQCVETVKCKKLWWRHETKTSTALRARCAGNSPVTGECPTQRPMTLNFDVFFDLRLNKWLSKQCRRRWFETPSRSLWRHCNVAMYYSDIAHVVYPVRAFNWLSLIVVWYQPVYTYPPGFITVTSLRDCVSNNQPLSCLLNRLFRRRSKKTSKLRVTGLCAGNSPVTGEFPAQKASNAEMFPFDDVIMLFYWHQSQWNSTEEFW